MAAKPARAPAPPSPPGSPLGGHLGAFTSDRLGFFTHCAREYGDVVGLRFGIYRLALVSDPALIESVLVTNNRQFTKHYALRMNRLLLGDGLLTSEGDFWRRQRRLAQPAFHRQRIAGYGDTMVDFTQRLVETWQDGETRDLHAEMMALTLQIVAKTLYDADVTDQADEVGRAMAVVMETFVERLDNLIMLPEKVPLPVNRRLQRAVRTLDAIVYRIIEERRSAGEDRGDLLSMLLAARDEDDGGRMTDRQLRDEVMTLFAAGHETTAIALSWTFYLLAQNPATVAALQAELDAILGGRAPSIDDLPRLRFTDQVVTEAMRLYPPAWIIGREATRDCTIGGYRIRRGTSVLMSQWVLHRDPRFFDDPDAFRPERWADGLAKQLPRFAYFPFGGGPRLCIGNAFAQMEAVLLLATIAQRCRFSLVLEHPVVPQPSLTMRPKYGVRVTLHRH